MAFLAGLGIKQRALAKAEVVNIRMAGGHALKPFDVVQANFGADPSALVRLEVAGQGYEALFTGVAEVAEAAIFDLDAQPYAC